jgi:hypothetical protein
MHTSTNTCNSIHYINVTHMPAYMHAYMHDRHTHAHIHTCPTYATYALTCTQTYGSVGISMQWMECASEDVRHLYKLLVSPELKPAYAALRQQGCEPPRWLVARATCHRLCVMLWHRNLNFDDCLCGGARPSVFSSFGSSHLTATALHRCTACFAGTTM